jgi:hypothetical protein
VYHRMCGSSPVCDPLCGGFAAEEERIKLLEAAQKLQRDLQAVKQETGIRGEEGGPGGVSAEFVSPELGHRVCMCVEP